MRKKVVIRLVILSSIAIVLTLIFRTFFNTNLDQIRIIVASFGIFAPIVYSLILFFGLTIPFNPISDFLTINAAALLFPPFISVIATFAAHTASLTLNYLVGRVYGDTLLRKLTSKEETKYIEDLAKKLTPQEIFGLRFILPITQVLGVDVISYVAGIEKISFTKFFLASIIPWTILNILYFYGTSYFKHYSIFLFFLPAVIIIFVPFLIFILRRLFKNRR